MSLQVLLTFFPLIFLFHKTFWSILSYYHFPTRVFGLAFIMTTQNQTQVRLKLVIDKKRRRILYGEADKTFVDFLFTILALPVGTMVKLLSTTTGQDMPNKLGSLGSLYRSVESLSTSCFEETHNKVSLLKPDLPPIITTPQSQIGTLLQIQPSSSPAAKTSTYYTCSECHYSVSTTNGIKCPRCNKPITINATYVYGADEIRPVVGGYVKGGAVKYMVMDDLAVKPMSCSSMFFLSVLNDLNVENVGEVDERLMYLNADDGVKLLRASLNSSTVLNDLFLSRINFSQPPPAPAIAVTSFSKLVNDGAESRRKRGRPRKVPDEPQIQQKKVAQEPSKNEANATRDDELYWTPSKGLNYYTNYRNNPNQEMPLDVEEGEITNPQN